MLKTNEMIAMLAGVGVEGGGGTEEGGSPGEKGSEGGRREKREREAGSGIPKVAGLGKTWDKKAGTITESGGNRE